MSDPELLSQLQPVPVSFTVNDQPVAVSVPAHRTLLDALRDDLCLTGSKKCCADGECGACTVFLDGELVNSCLVLCAETEGCSVTTIEGLSSEGLTDLQQEFLNTGAVQCGVCIPGQVMAAEGLLRENPQANAEEIRDAMAGNLCRCAGYERIVAAIQAAAGQRVQIQGVKNQ
jgi:carbon-monoxide dehydrogenase small subunit